MNRPRVIAANPVEETRMPLLSSLSALFTPFLSRTAKKPDWSHIVDQKTFAGTWHGYVPGSGSGDYQKVLPLRERPHVLSVGQS